MNKDPLVSVIIPFFNAKKFIEEAIESVFAQTYDHWELLLVDDGSTDGSTEIALLHAKKKEKVRYLEHKGHQNLGTCSTRNLGIWHSKGKYIAPLDSDDVWFPRKLEQQVAIMEAQPEAAMVYGSSLLWNGWTGKPEEIKLDVVSIPAVQKNILIKPPRLLTTCIFVPEHKAATPSPSNILLRRESVKRIGGFEDQFIGIYQMFEDKAFFTKLYLHESVFVTNACWDKYRIHPDSCCSVVTKNGYFNEARLFYLKWAEQYLLEQKIRTPKIWIAYRMKLWFHHHPYWEYLLRRYTKTFRLIIMRIKETISNSIPGPLYEWIKSKMKL